MKIIAKGIDDKFLIEATDNEIANTMGFYSYRSDGCPKILPGLEIKISEAFGRLEKIKYNSKALASARAELNSILTTLTKMEIVLVDNNVMNNK